jgi:hypothetical protein
MKSNLFLKGFILTSLFFYSCNVLKPTKSVSKFEKESKQDMLRELLEFEREKAMDPATGQVENQRIKAAWDYARTVRQQVKPLTRTSIANLVWEERGPNNIGGRTRSLLYDLNDATYKTVWAGSVGGGIWKTTDISQTNPNWVKINDFFDNIAITCIVQHPVNHDTMYFATGEGWGNSDALRGLGIWRSTNGGATWTQLASTNNSDFYYTQKMLVDNAGNVYAATRNNGLMKSTNHGTTWTKVLGNGVSGGSNDATSDIELGANNDVYVGFGIGNAGSIFKSTFATHGANTGNIGNWTNITPSGSFQRIELCCAPSDANKLYAICANGAGGTPLIRKSVDAGANWTNCASAGFCDQGSTNPDFTRGQYWYDLISCVNPTNPNTLYIGGVDGLKSTDAGATWTQITSWTGGGSGSCTAPSVYVHADHHAIVFKPGSSTEVLWGTDGGVSRSTDGGATFTTKNTGYNVTQYYAGAIHPTEMYYMIAGAQDNGSHRLNAAGISAGTSVSGGDGAFCHINQVDPTYQVTSYVYANYFSSGNGGASFTSMAGNSNSGRFINPTEFDNVNNRMYGCYGGGNYELIENIGITNDRSTRSVSAVTGANRLLSAAKVDPNNPNTVWMGYSRSNPSQTINLIKVNNAASATPLITNKTTGLPTTSGIYLAGIDIQKGDSNHVIICISNYGENSLWETTDGGSNWTSVEGNMPDIPVRCVMFHPDSSDMAIIGTELGVWSTNNLNGATTDWSQSNSGLANTRVEMLRYRTVDHTLLAATHGRGLFTAVLPHTPEIYFSSSATNVVEQPTTTIGCRSFKDYTVNLQCSNTPAGPINTSVGIAIGNATQGQDYDFTTNGNFTSPSTTCIFTSGVMSIPVTVRIYDDNTHEPILDTFQLNFVINSGTAVQGDLNTSTYRISDNSDNPLLSRKTIWSENFESGTNPPANWTYIQSNTNRWGNKNFVCGSTINNFTMQVFNNATNTCEYNNAATSTAIVRRAVNATNYSNLQVSFDWIGDGEAGYDWGELVTSTNTVTPTWVVVPGSPQFGGSTTITNSTINLPASLNNTTFLLGWRWKNDNNTGSLSMGFDNVVVTGESTRSIENALSTKTAYLGPNEDAYYYNSDGDLMARIENLSNHNYGCTTLEIDRAGNGAQFITGESDVMKKVFDKAIKVTPTTNNPSGSYRFTLYVTNAEKNGYEAEGRTWNTDANLFKMPISIGLASIATARDYATNLSKVTYLNGYSITGEFSTGFSGFGVGNPGITSVLPLDLISFAASWKGNEAFLNWKTENEKNVKQYGIERSLNGSEFSEIGKVVPNNQSSNSYSYTDSNIPFSLSSDFYYRLKMIDIDGGISYSVVEKLNKSSMTGMIVYPNPVYNIVQIAVSKISTIIITDQTGKIIVQKTLNAGTNSLTVAHLQVGVYYIKNTQTEEVIKFEKK